MPSKEIERKWIVPHRSPDDLMRTAEIAEDIVQGYLGIIQDMVVRIRIATVFKNRQDGMPYPRAFLTFKGVPTGELQATRVEIESILTTTNAKYLLSLCGDSIIHKTRYHIRSPQNINHVFHVDQYLDRHVGCTVAELELKSEKEQVTVPDWCGKEVTGKEQYSNYWLATTKWNWETIHKWDEHMEAIQDGKHKNVSMGCKVDGKCQILENLAKERKPLFPTILGRKSQSEIGRALFPVEMLPESKVVYYKDEGKVMGDAADVDSHMKEHLKDEDNDE